MSTSEASGWRKSWILGVIALAVIIFSSSKVWKNLHQPMDNTDSINQIAKAMALDPTSFSLAEHAAAEAARLLDTSGGSVALVIPSARELLDYSYGGAYAGGFRSGMQRHANIKLEGIYFASPPYVGNQHEDQRAPTFARLQDVRQTHPQAKVIISFLGLPQFTPEEQVAWLQSNPPKMIVVDAWAAEDRQIARQALSAGLIDAMIINTRPADHPENLLPKDAMEPQPVPPSLFDTMRRM